MGKQKGPVFITGTYNGICYYEMDGEYYFRRVSSLQRNRVKEDTAFELTRVYAGIFGQASAIAGEVYRMLPFEKRERPVYRAMTSMANRLLKHKVSAEEVKDQLMAAFRLAGVDDIAVDDDMVSGGGNVPASKDVDIVAKVVGMMTRKAVGRPVLSGYRCRLYVSTKGMEGGLDMERRLVMWAKGRRKKQLLNNS